MSSQPPYLVPVPSQGNEYRGLLVNIFNSWVVGLTAIVVSLRVITRYCLVETRLWWDDYLIVTALCTTIIGASLNAVEVHFGFGRHEHFITPYMLQYFNAYVYGEWIQTFTTLMCTKLSICFFLLRLPVSKAYIRPLQVAIILLIVSNLILTILWIFQCRPVHALWNMNVRGSCFTTRQMLDIILAQAIISVISDFALAFYPILILRKLHTTFKYKIGIATLMGLGVITGACCIVRTALNDEALPTDQTYGGLTNWFWRMFEVNIGIIAACIPTLMPGYKWVRSGLGSQRRPSIMKLLTPKSKRSAREPPSKQAESHGRPIPMVRPPRANGTTLGQSVEGLVPDDVEAQVGARHVEYPAAAARAQFTRKFDEGFDLPIQMPEHGGSLSGERQSSEVTAVEDVPAGKSQAQAVSPSLSTAPMVKKPVDPRPSLEVDLEPRFEGHRSVWARMLDSITEGRRSWKLKSSVVSGGSKM